MFAAYSLGAGTAILIRGQFLGDAPSLNRRSHHSQEAGGLFSMTKTDEMLRTERERYLRAIIEWRRERDASEAKLRAAEHELAQSLARFYRTP